MAIRTISEYPDAALVAEYGATRRAATAVGLAIPVARRANWLLRASKVVAMFHYPGSIDTLTAAEGRIYHRASANCQRVLCSVLIDQATSSSGKVGFTPSGGSIEEFEYPLTLNHSIWGGDSGAGRAWQRVDFVADIAAPGLQYHTIEWDDLKVRSVVLLELPRDKLDTSADTMVAYQGSGYAGIRAGRMITDGAAGGINDILAAIASADTDTRRAGGGFLLPSADAWTEASGAGAVNMFDSVLGTSGEGFRHQARQMREASTDREYSTVFRARYTHSGATPSASVSLTSSETSVGVTKPVTDTWAWYVDDGVDVINIATNAEDTLILEGETDSADTQLEVSSVQFLE